MTNEIIKISMTYKQLLSQAKLGRKVSAISSYGDEITGYLAGLDDEYAFIVLYDHTAAYPGTGSAFKKYLLRLQQTDFELWDSSTLDSEPEQIIDIVKPFRNWASKQLDNAGKRRD